MFVLKPIAHETIWGGKRLLHLCKTDATRIGHLYSIFCRENISNEVLNGQNAGQKLNSLMNVIGKFPGYSGYDYFPLTLALVDAEENLSIQVHPGDGFAQMPNACVKGKRESWYFLEKPETGWIYNGCRCGCTDELQKNMDERRWERITDKLDVKAGDYVFVNPGTLHALTAGSLVYEIEEGSDLTYRVYDYDRKDGTGQKRELHRKQALQSIHCDYKSESCEWKTDTKIHEKTYELFRCENINMYQNKSNTIECFTLIEGYGQADGVEISSGMTTLLMPGEYLDGINGQCVIVSKMISESRD